MLRTKENRVDFSTEYNTIEARRSPTLCKQGSCMSMELVDTTLIENISWTSYYDFKRIRRGTMSGPGV
uniref:Uncharacterized protein n=1 Tax=Steinernema glaseri TaxID=37863 RepID=A0A1I7YZ05_9BILA